MTSPQISLPQALRQLQATFDAMPPVAAMQVRVGDYREQRLAVDAPLAANVNDKGNAFGGSLCSVMTLAAWAWVTLQLRLAGHEADVYVADSQVRYLRPVYEDLHAEAGAGPGADWEGFLATFRQRGKARIAMVSRLLPGGQPAAAELDGRFVAMARR
ncbi:YiiD C-terminal domain-containing protein [Stenotrophomonas sp. MMGLT7]|uniref:YiiD C-terminal domain-containing protein n=1 Tax=Stenotrophomonas sp. MMGLT7 TaxID=2901227 RepID=UPI001E5E4BFB|nr:YiiD C-terminal domain-containing protein [Stenotrophomonas sp. MMGLT7]MCD7099895.1 thioesterase domain-containing protein [Stenotrophomonas sp. MMGLT7]